MQHTQRLSIASLLVAIPALILLGLAGIASADGGQSQNQVSYTLTAGGMYVTYGGHPDYSGMSMRHDTYTQHKYMAVLSNTNEVPPVPKMATGQAKVTFTGDEGHTMGYWIQVSNPNDPVTAGHLHCAPPGVNGPVVVGLFNFGAGQEMNGYATNGNIQSIAPTGKDCKGTIGYPINSMKDLVRAIKEGKIYVNVHSKAYPDGVTRGQLTIDHQGSYGGGSTGGGYGGGGDSHDYNKKDYDKKDYDHDKDKKDYSDSGYGHDKKDNHDYGKQEDKKDYDHKKDEYKDEWKEDDEWKKDEHKDWNTDEQKDDWGNKDEWKEGDGWKDDKDGKDNDNHWDDSKNNDWDNKSDWKGDEQRSEKKDWSDKGDRHDRGDW